MKYLKRDVIIQKRKHKNGHNGFLKGNDYVTVMQRWFNIFMCIKATMIDKMRVYGKYPKPMVLKEWLCLTPIMYNTLNDNLYL